MMTLIAFIGAIALLVTIHEFGHYWVARRCGVKVLVFSLGFGKVIYRKRFANSDTEWLICAIPLGGYVKMLDEREGEVRPCELAMAFNRKSVWQRMAIVAAGPLANFLLAILLYWVLFIHGLPGFKPVLGEVAQGTPAAQAQLRSGQTIISINGEKIPSWQALRWSLLTRGLQGETVKIQSQDVHGATSYHFLDLSRLKANELEGAFLVKLGLKLKQPILLPIIGKLSEQGVAKQAGLQPGDLILRANGEALKDWGGLVKVVRAHPGQRVKFDIQRGAMSLNLTLIPKSVSESGKRVGKIGAAPKINQVAWQAMMTTVSYPPVTALGQSLKKTWDTTIISLEMMGKMVQGEISMKNLSGPITIADYAGQSARMGWVAYLSFLALISISLGVLNLMPVPLLDGGHLLYYVAELIKGSPVSDQVWEYGQKIGIALLGTLMILAFYNDINRYISG
ncbi:MAG: RIP metalloprotease RseP [Gallionella sp.]